ncbi:MAG: ABC transporter permease [Dactylosporangium sp.]|nr:ABC transporter permease [Dactylosporangium sp.]NNJ61157.1 ABC transporter permease [Dactylosporangium sp.]
MALIRHFVLLKLRILGNGMRPRGTAGSKRLVMFIVGVVLGLWMATAGFAVLAIGSSSDDADVRIAVVGLTGALVTAGWLLLPLLFFGVDETIDPARFALLPIPRRILTTGMVVAACVGIPAVATLIATLGLVVGGAVRGGTPAALFAVPAAILSLLLCVLGSRAVTSAFASMLRSRRMRDLAIILIVVVSGSLGPGQLAIASLVEQNGLGPLTTAGRVLGWTPLAAAHAAVLEAGEGRWPLAMARLAIVVVALALLAWWWSVTLEQAMLGTSTTGPRDRKVSGSGGAVDALIPAVLRGLPAGGLIAIVARDLRYFWRDPRWRASFASLGIVSLFLPFMLVVMTDEGRAAAPLPAVTLFIGVIIGISLANIFGSDGLAFATHLLVGVPGRMELRARIVSLALVVVPLLTLVTIMVGLLRPAAASVPAALGTAAAGFGTAAALSVTAAVLMPYPMPQAGNPFAVSSGGALLRSLLVLVGMVSAIGMTGPVIAAYVLLPETLIWLLLPIGGGWGVFAVLIGTYIAGDALDRRGPEVLTSITPRL